MEFVKVAYPTNRYVYIDGDQGGTTNDVLRIEAGTHEFNLGSLKNYLPESQQIDVEGTTVLLPIVVVFTKKT